MDCCAPELQKSLQTSPLIMAIVWAAVCFGTGLFCPEWRKELTAGLLPPSPGLVAFSTAAPLPAHPGCSHQISARPAVPTASASQCGCGHRGHTEVPVRPSSSSWAVLEVSLQPWGLCREKPESTVLWHHIANLPALKQLPQHRTAGARWGCRVRAAWELEVAAVGLCYVNCSWHAVCSCLQHGAATGSSVDTQRPGIDSAPRRWELSPSVSIHICYGGCTPSPKGSA